MPRIWIEYCQCLIEQQLITRTRKAFDRALRSLPATQHDRIWPIYIGFVRAHDIHETTIRVYRRYLKVCLIGLRKLSIDRILLFQLMPDSREDFIEYLQEIDRLDEAAKQMAIIVNDEKFVSQRGISQHQVFIYFIYLLISVCISALDRIMHINIEKSEQSAFAQCRRDHSSRHQTLHRSSRRTMVFARRILHSSGIVRQGSMSLAVVFESFAPFFAFRRATSTKKRSLPSKQFATSRKYSTRMRNSKSVPLTQRWTTQRRRRQ